jgi:hypothetical protein
MNFEAIFSSLGIFSLTLGQSIMLVVGPANFIFSYQQKI